MKLEINSFKLVALEFTVSYTEDSSSQIRIIMKMRVICREVLSNLDAIQIRYMTIILVHLKELVETITNGQLIKCPDVFVILKKINLLNKILILNIFQGRGYVQPSLASRTLAIILPFPLI